MEKLGCISKQIRLVVKAIPHGRVFAGEATNLGTRFAGDPGMGHHEPGHLRPHGGERDTAMLSNITSSLDLVVGKDEVRAADVGDDVAQAVIDLWPPRVVELLALNHLVTTALGLIVPSAKLVVKLPVLAGCDGAANQMDS